LGQKREAVMSELVRSNDRSARYLMSRDAKSTGSLNDHAEVVFLELYSEEKFKRLLQAVWPEESVNGTLDLDDVEAATMIQERAASSISETIRRRVGEADRKAIVHALRVVMRRYGISRAQRRHTLANKGGRLIPEQLGSLA
jgi:hypothetical protein